MTTQQAMERVAMICALYPNVEDTRMAALAAQLERYEDTPALRRGLQTMIDNERGEFLPVWSTWRRYIGKATVEDQLGYRVPSPGSAWKTLEKTIRDVGGYQTPEWSDPLLAATVARLGWRWLCWPGEDDQWVRKRFEETYNELADVAFARGELPAMVRTPGIQELGTGRGGGLEKVEPKAVE